MLVWRPSAVSWKYEAWNMKGGLGDWVPLAHRPRSAAAGYVMIRFLEVGRTVVASGPIVGGLGTVRTAYFMDRCGVWLCARFRASRNTSRALCNHCCETQDIIPS